MPRRAKARRSRHASAKVRSTATRARRERSVAALGEVLSRVAIAAEATIVGLAVLARHARDREAGAAKLAEELGEELRGVASTARFVGEALGLPLVAPARRSTCERLRWEWIASTGALLDGGPAGRLRVECVVALERTRGEAARLFELVQDEPSAAAASHLAEQLERRLKGALARLEAAPIGGEGLGTRAFATM